MYLQKKDYARGLDELKEATILAPSDHLIHETYAQGLLRAEKLDEAVVAFKESLLLGPDDENVRADLAAALEKKGDWAGALEQWRERAYAEAHVDRRDLAPRPESRLTVQKDYEAAQQRFKQHLAALKAAGKAGEAAELEARVRADEASPKISGQLDAALLAGDKANSERRFDEAIRQYKEAVGLAEQLNPHTQQLAIALDHLGNCYMGQDWAAADAAFGRELKVTEEIFGPQSPNLALPMQALGTSALLQKKYDVAFKYYSQAANLYEKTYGEGSQQFADSQRVLARVYLVQKQYEKAEPYLVRAVKTDESFMGHDNPQLLMPLSALCGLYEDWGKAEKSEACDSHLLEILEKQYGADSPVLLSTLASEAKALRSLGRGDKAGEIEKKIEAIRTAAVNPEQ